MFFKGARGLVRLKPSMMAAVSTAKASDFTKGFDDSEDLGGSGCQTAMKSPPGPNMQSGSVSVFLSGVIFI